MSSDRHVADHTPFEAVFMLFDVADRTSHLPDRV